MAGERKAGKLRDHEKVLVERILAGHEEAFEEFADDYIPSLYRYAGRRLRGERELIREIVQTTLCKAISKLGSFRGEAALTTWLISCCKNEIAAHYRRAGRAARQIELPTDDLLLSGSSSLPSPDGPERSLLRRERVRLVHDALDALPPHYGRALEWKYFENLPVREIARRLELGPKAAESLLTRAREAFRTGYRRLVDLSPDAAVAQSSRTGRLP